MRGKAIFSGGGGRRPFACCGRGRSVPCCAHRFAEALEMHDFACAQEFERLAHVRVVDQAQQVVVGGAGFLLCCNLTSANNANPRTTSTLFYDAAHLPAIL